MNNVKRRLTGLGVLVALALAVGLLPPRLMAAPVAQNSPAIDENVIARVVPAVVQIGPIARVTDAGGDQKLIYLGWGSGTLISSDGYILTNRQVADVNAFAESLQDRQDVQVLADKLAVFMATDAESPPVPAYIAEVAGDSAQYNLAVLHITEDLTGKSVDGSSLDLPFVPLGDSGSVKLGQKISIFGFPATEGETITLTSADVSGFSFESGVQGRAWIKTSQSVSGGNRGGAAVDDSGALVGVPAEAGDVGTECHPVRDTNGDGKVDDSDICVPLGGAINALRPIDLAKTLITQVTKGVGPNPSPTRPSFPRRTPSPSPQRTPPPLTTPTEVFPPQGTITPALPRSTSTPETPIRPGSVSRLFFSNGVADNGSDPTGVVTRLPSGSNSLVMYFDYKDFEDGVTFQPRIFIDGKEERDAFPAKPWDAQQFGTYGTYWFGYLNTEEPLPDGTYVFQVDYDDRTLDKATIEVGGPPLDTPQCGGVTFSGGGETGSPLPAGIKSIDASCQAGNMGGVTTLSASWSALDDAGDWQSLATHNIIWRSGATGTMQDTLAGQETLTGGFYRLEFMNGSDLLATADVYVMGGGGGNGSAPQFGPITFGDQEDDNGNITNPGTQFPSGTYKLYASWDYHNMAQGTQYNITWKINGDVSNDNDYTWQGDPDGTVSDYYLYRTDDSPLDDGTYELDLSIEGTQVQSATATLGSGEPLPTPSPTVSVAGTVKISGTIKDGITGRAIEGAIFMVLKEGETWSTFDNLDSQVLDSATTDVSGRFVLNTPLQRGHAYSIGVFATGYQTLTEDGVEITNDLPSLLNLPIKLQPGF